MKISFRHIINEIKENFLAEQSRWIAWVPFLFACGIALYFSLPFEPNYWWILILFELVLGLFYLLRHRNVHLLFTAILIVFCGFIDIQMQSVYHQRQVLFSRAGTMYLRGRISDISYSAKGKERLLLENVYGEEAPLIGKYRVTLMSKNNNFKINQCVELVGTFFAPAPLQVLNGYQLDRKYFYENLSGIGYANSEVFEIDCPKNVPVSTFKSRINAVRKNIAADISQILPTNEAGVVNAVLIGEQTGVSPLLVEQYRNSGLAHFLSVSGLHLGSIAGLVFFVVRFLLSLFPALALRYDIKKISAVTAIFFSALYLLISGMAIPAERAFIMTAVVLVGVIYNRQAISIRMVSFAAFVVLLISPQALISISFQMSFAAVVALIAFYEKYAAAISKWGRNRGFVYKIFLYLGGIVICDFVASLATMPFAVYHFHRVAVYTSLANLLAGPLIGLWLMPLILSCLVFIPFGWGLYPLKMLGVGVEWLNKITEFVSALPHSVAYVDSLPFWGFIFIVCGAYWFCVWQLPWRKWGMVPIVIGCLSLFFPQAPDVVFAVDGAGVAVRNQQGELVMLSPKVDSWIARVWTENLHLKVLNKEEKQLLKDIYDGRKVVPDYVAISCDDEKCTYHDRVIIFKNGKIMTDRKTIDNSAGGYIYLNGEGVEFRPFWRADACRLWHRCSPSFQE